MSTKAWISIIASVVFIGILTFLGVWLYTNFSKVQQGIGGTGLYTQEDIDNAYRDGYDTALTNEAEYLAQIEAYRDQVTNLTDTIAQLNSGSKDLENQIATLTASNNSKNNTISELRAEILTLQNSIANLSSQVANLTTDNSNLNIQLAQIQGQALSYTTTINRLNSLVTYLTNTVIDWENRAEFLATFFVNGMVWDIQVIDHINTAVTVPTSPVGDFVFAGWSLDGDTVINPTQIDVVTDIEFHAVINVTATFLLDGTTYETQTIRQGTVPETPAQPNGNFTFVGWSNGTAVIDIGNIALTQNTIFVAVYTYTVKFVSEGNTIKMQEISHGNFATPPTAPIRTGYTFTGWTTDGTTSVTVSNVVITQPTTFTALWEINRHTVKFIVDGETVATQTVNYNSTVTVPTNPTKAGYRFEGWTIDGATVVGLLTYTVKDDTTFVALFKQGQWHTIFSAYEQGWGTGGMQVNYGSYELDLNEIDITSADLIGKLVRIVYRFEAPNYEGFNSEFIVQETGIYKFKEIYSAPFWYTVSLDIDNNKIMLATIAPDGSMAYAPGFSLSYIEVCD